MPEEKLNKINTIGSTISVWGKLLIGLIVFIISVGTAWYQIETNAADNVRQDENIKTIIGNQQKQFDQMMDNITREFEIQSNRSDKRYERAMQEAKELHIEIDKHDQQILDIYKEIWYIKGKMGL
jgi:predicted RND superfamily exporter protein